MSETGSMPMRDRMGLGGRAAEQTFATFDARVQPKAYEIALSFMDKPRTLVFSGGNGLGKTHLAVAIANAIIEKHGMMPVHICLVTFQDALRKLKETYRDGYEGMGEEWWLDRWHDVPVLILDEVGQAGLEDKPSQFTRRIGYDLVDARYRAGNRPIVMTTNKTPGQLGDWITESAVSRLQEMGEFVLMTGKDWRLKK